MSRADHIPTPDLTGAQAAEALRAQLTDDSDQSQALRLWMASEAVAVWVAARNRRRIFATTAGFAWTFTFLLAAGWLAPALVVGVAWWSYNSTYKRQRATLVRDIATVLAEGLRAEPFGLSDLRWTYQFLDETRVDTVASPMRGITLRGYAAMLFLLGGLRDRSNCSSGHQPLCEHRLPAPVRDMWTAIAREAAVPASAH